MSRPTAPTVRRILLAATLLDVMALAIGALLVPSTEAAPSGNCTYYSSGSYTTVVGQYGYDCCNNRVAWGTKTRFSKCGGGFVCFPPGPRSRLRGPTSPRPRGDVEAPPPA